MIFFRRFGSRFVGLRSTLASLGGPGSSNSNKDSFLSFMHRLIMPLPRNDGADHRVAGTIGFCFQLWNEQLSGQPAYPSRVPDGFGPSDNNEHTRPLAALDVVR